MKMADEVFSVKIDNELKQELEQLAESSGQNKKEFMASLIASYQSRLLEKQSNEPEIPEISALNQHVRRIEEIYVSLAASRRDIATEAVQKQTALNTELATLKAELLDTRKAAELAKIESKGLVDSVLAETANQIEAAENKSAELVSRAVNAEETANLTKKLLEAEQKVRVTAEATTLELTARVKNAEIAVKEIQADADRANDQVEKFKKVIAAATEKMAQYEKNITELNARHVDQIASIQDHATIEKERAVLLAEKASFDQIQALQNALNETQKALNASKAKQ
jgi:chromosome segregation ATPase